MSHTPAHDNTTTAAAPSHAAPAPAPAPHDPAAAGRKKKIKKGKGKPGAGLAAPIPRVGADDGEGHGECDGDGERDGDREGGACADEHGHPANGVHHSYDSAVTLDEADEFDQLDYGYRPGVGVGAGVHLGLGGSGSGSGTGPGSTPLFNYLSGTGGGAGAFDPTGLVPQIPNLTHQDLLNTANELYRRMEDPHFATDDAYWTSLPVHLRNFIRNALPLAPGGGVAVNGNGAGNGAAPGPLPSSAVKDSQQAMYAMAQQIVSAANHGQMGMAHGGGAGHGQNFAGGMLVGNASIFPGGVATAAGLGKMPMNGLQHHGMMNGGELGRARGKKSGRGR